MKKILSIIVVVVVFGVLAFYAYPKEEVVSPEGFSFEYPQTYELADSTVIEDSYYYTFYERAVPQPEGGRVKVVTEKIDGRYCHLGFCDLPGIKAVRMASGIFDDLGDQKYCDAGACSPSMKVYRTTQDGNRIYVIFTAVSNPADFLTGFSIKKAY